ncbi:MAG: PASTA domain-containing protein [Erysipelotrichaceae bacterium]|nr:PASTA domain-containing protein [Erysipelotrichaceae bacterium]
MNGGTLYTPYIVKRLIEPETGEIIQENKPKKVRDVITKSTSETVRMALESVVALGSGRNAYIEGYRVGGKTGTAQKVNNGVYMVGNYITSFIGFLPANDPKIIVYVAIDNPKGITAYGGTVAAPIAKNILEDGIVALDIEKQEGGISKDYRFFDVKYETVEDVVGMDAKEARKKLSNFDVEYSGTGNRVVSMSPEAGSRIAVGSTVRLMLENE